jgi:DNA-binding transcriptional LysR family regulator
MLYGRLPKYLDEVARCGSIRKAAGHLNVASSAVNRQILALEQELGTPLFHRLPRKLVLTTAGEILIRHIRETLRDLDRVEAQIEELKGMRRGEVSIAIMSGLASNLLPLVIGDFRRIHPRVKVGVQLLSTGAEILSAVVGGEADLGLGFDFPPTPTLRTVSSFICRLGAVMASRHPLAERSSLRLSDCLDYPLIIADETTAIRPHLDAAFAKISVKLEPALETNSVEMMRHAAMLNQGISFLTPIDIETDRQQGKLVYVPIQGVGIRAQTLTLVSRDRGANPTASALAELLRTMIAEVAGINASPAL